MDKSHTEPSTRTISTRFTFFAFLFYAAAFFHQLSWAHDWFINPLGQIYIFAAFWGMLRPSSFGRFLFFVAVSAIKFSVDVPFLANHLMFEWLIHLSILVVIAFHFISQNFTPINKEDVFSNLAALLRLSIVILYFFTFLAKLNADFFLPEYSCASFFLNQVAEKYSLHWRFSQPFAQSAAIWGTVVLEFMLPILLIIPKTRHLGILVGMVFHFAMGVVPNEAIYSFSALAYVFLSLFLNDAAILKLEKMIVTVSGRVMGRVKTLWPIALFIFWYATLYAKGRAYPNPSIGFNLWLVYTFTIGVIYLLLILPSSVVLSTGKKSFFRLEPTILYILLLPLIVNAILPYIGFKNHGSFTMFSNLRVLGAAPNHFLFAKPLKLVDNQLVKIIASDHPKLQEYAGGFNLLTRFELRRLVCHDITGDLELTYEMDGRVQTFTRIKGEVNDPELLKPISWMERKMRRFKPEDSRLHAHCMW